MEYALLITLGAMLIVNPVLSSTCRRLGIPALVGYIGLGVLVSVLDARWHFVTVGFESTFATLGQMGVVALLFRVGLRSHTSALLARLPDASLIWIGDVLANVALGYVVAHYVLGFSLETSIVVATAFSATSVAVSVSVWDEAGMLRSSRGSLLLDVAELDDLSGVLLMAVALAVLPLLQSSPAALVENLRFTVLDVLIKLTLFIAGCYLFAHFLEARFTRFSRDLGGSPLALTISILGAGLTIAALAGYLGFSLAVGALFAGLAFSRDPQAVRTDGRFAYFYEFLTPFFFIHIGMQVDPTAVFSAVDLGLVLFAAAALGKLLGVGVPALLAMGRHDALTMGISMIPRAEIALVIVSQCRQLGDAMVSAEVYSAMIMVTLLSSIIAPILLRRRLGGHG